MSAVTIRRKLYNAYNRDVRVCRAGGGDGRFTYYAHTLGRCSLGSHAAVRCASRHTMLGGRGLDPPTRSPPCFLEGRSNFYTWEARAVVEVEASQAKAVLKY